MDGKDSLINIAAFTPATRVLGPGLRAALWVQGCPHRCDGCIAPEWWQFKVNRLISPEELFEELLVEPVRGLTISGGEPMLQAAALTRLVQLARKRQSLDVICYTGFVYEDLLSLCQPAIQRFLFEIDILIDGQYIASQDDQQGLRGSSNQRIIHLSERMKDFDFETSSRKVEIHVEDGELFFVGLPDGPLSKVMNKLDLSMDAMALKLQAAMR